MSKEDFLRKISSRKFWALVSALVVSILVMANVGENTVSQVVAIIGAFASVIVYILGEASIDREAINKEDEK